MYTVLERFDILLIVQALGSVILVASLFFGGLSAITVVGGVIVLAAVSGMAAGALLDDELDQPAERERGVPDLDAHPRR